MPHVPYLHGWHVLLVVAELALRVGVMVHIVMRGPRRGATTLAWLLVLVLLPVVGLVTWFLVGEVRMGRGRRRRYREHYAHAAAEVARVGPHDEHRFVPPGYEGWAALAEAVDGTPPRGGNHVELLADTDETLDSLVRDIDAARESCHLLFYIVLDDAAGRRVAEALARAAARGVACRLLVDDVGSRPFLRSRTCARLRRADVRVVGALPNRVLGLAIRRIDVRNHRKIAVVDGSIGYTGSQNLAEASFAPKPRYAPWVDCMLRMRGPVVRDLQAIFASDWYLDAEEPIERLFSADTRRQGDVTVQVVATGPLNDNEAMEQLVLNAFYAAREELILTTPYFVPGEAEVQSLCTAARRGVSVVLVIPARNDSRLVAAVSRSHYRALLDSGVEIFEYQKGLLHAKTMTVDRDLALVTTANFDRRSFDLNFEVSTLVYDTDFASRLRFLQRSYVQDSLAVTHASVARRPWSKRLFDNAVGVFSPLL